ncbi:MAG: hypothetical protein AAGC46_00350 [Solirubrobacteraceae bacterium]|nr:hypothetical protein [Patulibacter sp.]
MGESLLSARDLTRTSIETLLASARSYEVGTGTRHEGAVVGLWFFEDSVRTRVGFDVAAARLGARTAALVATKRSDAMGYAESVEDAVRSVADWCDVACLRTGDPTLVGRLTGSLRCSIVNCGNGLDEHPSQAVADVFAIQRQVGAVDGLRIAIVGNLLESRTARSLALTLGSFDGVTIRSIAPRGLHLPAALHAELTRNGVTVEETATLDVDDVDVVYVAGLPAGTPDGGRLAPEEQAALRITPAVVRSLQPQARILCPLPRLDEIERDVDDLDAAGYFEQSRTALFTRMAILDRALAA